MKLLAIFLFALAGVLPTYTQRSVAITPRKVAYTRPKPTMDYKRKFSINYPRVRASNPALSKKIESTISYARNFGVNLREELNESQWLEEADFEVKYNARGLLCITLFISGSGAYPSGVSKTLVVNLTNGSRISPTDVLIKQNELAAEIRKKQKSEIEAAIKELRQDPDKGDSDPADLFKETIFTTKDLAEFEIDDNGISFIYDYNFPHVIQAWQPEGKFTFTWVEIARFIRPNSPFARFILR